MMSAAIVSALWRALTHPWTLLFLQLSIFGATAATTKPTSSARYGTIIIMVALAHYFFQTVHERVDNRSRKTLVSGFIILAILCAIERLLLGKWNFEADGPEEHRRLEAPGEARSSKEATNTTGTKTTKSKLWFAIDTVCNPRGIGKPWQIKNVPPFSSSDPSYVPSRKAFLLRKLVSIVICFIIYDAGFAQSKPQGPLIALDKQPFFSRYDEISRKEFHFRINCAIGFWVGHGAYLNLFVNIFSFVVVALGISEPAAWRPLFGSPMEAYSIRQFWG